MAETPASPAPAEAAAPPKAALKKGSLVRLSRAAYEGSLEARASDPELPAYILEGPGEILAINGEHAQLRWRRPVPDVWLRLDQLEAFPG
jgi:hypothetical protein